MNISNNQYNSNSQYSSYSNAKTNSNRQTVFDRLYQDSTRKSTTIINQNNIKKKNNIN
jgi:hypothetical protein